MNKLILCEGVTDAYFLSYYLSKVSGWKYSKDSPDGLSIKNPKSNESINWYKKDNDYLLICGVGGKDNFKKFFKKRIETPIITTNAFSKIAIITDRDNRTTEEIIKEISPTIEERSVMIENNQWISNNYIDRYNLLNNIDFLLTIIPFEEQGALETIMLNAICENPYDRNIVEKSSKFVQEIRNEASRYISSDRLQLKAQLSVTWAIQSPEKVFSTINELICSVQWEKYDILNNCFKKIKDI